MVRKMPKTKDCKAQLRFYCCVVQIPVDTCRYLQIPVDTSRYLQIPVHTEGSELLRAGRARISSSIPGKSKNFSSFPKRLYRLWGPSQAPLRRMPHAVSPTIRQSECAADHSHLESILRMIEATLYSRICLHAMCRHNLAMQNIIYFIFVAVSHNPVCSRVCL